MVCDICGKKGALVRKITKSYGKGKNLFIVENVPVVYCPHCGGGYLTATTLHEIERLRTHRKSLSVSRPVEVVNFS